MSNGRNPIINGTGMAVLIGIALVILPWIVGIENHTFAKLFVNLLGIVIFLLGLRFSGG